MLLRHQESIGAPLIMKHLIDQSSWTSELEELRRTGLYRVMPSVGLMPGRTITVNGRTAINFSSNNYLGLAGHPEIVQAFVDCVTRYGAGSTASRLIAGNTEPHRELESFIAGWKETDAALVFGSGYQANLGILSTLAGEGDLIISDELNHASIIDGCRLSKARVMIYPHLDLSALESILRLSGFRRRVVVTESIFSMDGDCAPLKEIDYLCRRWRALLMVDEAHATGVRGPQGQGLAAEQGVIPEIQMGTLGKAAGTSGAYAAGSRPLIELLTNKCRSLIYTTAAPPGTAGAALAALKIIASSEGDQRRSRLGENVLRFYQAVNPGSGDSSVPSHIVPVRIGDSRTTLQVSEACLEQGIFAHGIRFPTVPEGTARLRFTLMSDHTEEDINMAASVLEDAMNKAEPIKRTGKMGSR
jgi:8-amino-7-oxononanoate synthase